MSIRNKSLLYIGTAALAACAVPAVAQGTATTTDPMVAVDDDDGDEGRLGLLGLLGLAGLLGLRRRRDHATTQTHTRT